MKPREIFKLAIRILGLVFLYHGLTSVPILFSGIFNGLGNAINCILLVAWPLLVAYWLISGASPIMSLAYPETEE
jgi:hypothetical protein